MEKKKDIATTIFSVAFAALLIYLVAFSYQGQIRLGDTASFRDTLEVTITGVSLEGENTAKVTYDIANRSKNRTISTSRVSLVALQGGSIKSNKSTEKVRELGPGEAVKSFEATFEVSPEEPLKIFLIDKKLIFFKYYTVFIKAEDLQRGVHFKTGDFPPLESAKVY